METDASRVTKKPWTETAKTAAQIDSEIERLQESKPITQSDVDDAVDVLYQSSALLDAIARMDGVFEQDAAAAVLGVKRLLDAAARGLGCRAVGVSDV